MLDRIPSRLEIDAVVEGVAEVSRTRTPLETVLVRAVVSLVTDQWKISVLLSAIEETRLELPIVVRGCAVVVAAYK
jgi:hypothetical protein